MESDKRQPLIERIRAFPGQLELLVTGLTPTELTSHPLRDEWSVAQNIHHLADEHANMLLRCKFVVAEDKPLLVNIEQDAWAALPDSNDPVIEDARALLRAAHARIARFFEARSEADWQCEGVHTRRGLRTLEHMLIGLAEHCDAHLIQITNTLAARSTH